MMRASSRGLTLIEILISLGIGMILVAMGTSALLHVAKTFARNTALMQGHDDAAAIASHLHATVESLYHPALIRCHADIGSDAVWGSGDEVIELTWMNSVRSLDESTMTYAPRPMHDLIWRRLVWSGDGQGGGTLTFSNSSGQRIVKGWTYTHNGVTRRPQIALGPFVRRDRRRDLDDNDLRFLPGMDMATYTSVGAAGDSADLDSRLTPWHPPTTRVAHCFIELIDQGGYVIRCDPATGISIHSPTGTTIPTLGTPYSNATTLVLDGCWLDGRAHVPDDVPPGSATYHLRSTAAQRPALIRISYELVMTTPGDRVRFDKDPRLPFTVTICPTMALPPL